MSQKTLVEAVNIALKKAMTDDQEVIVMGEDVGINGGVFRATAGLREQFGFQRVIDTPLAETMIAGTAIGMAIYGLKPVFEIQFMGFIYATLEQIISHAARMRNRTRGRLSCPLVLRAPFGGGIHAPEHHSESTEAIFAHIPGLRVVIPSSPVRAFGLLQAAIHNPDPVIFLEPKRIYRSIKENINENMTDLPLDQCFVLKEGGDITLISWGAMITETLAAAEKLANAGIIAEVIDVATLKPIDFPTLESSVCKTGRCIIIHEAARSGGIGGEISATLTENCFNQLKAPIQRVTGFDTIMPYLKYENYYLPNKNDILLTAIKLLEYQ